MTLLRCLAPLDALRGAVLGIFGARFRGILARREERIALGAALGVALAFALTIRLPLALFALGPLVLGVPHLLADLRYLVVQPGLHRHRHALLVALPLVGSLLHPAPAIGLAAVVVAALIAPVSHAKSANTRIFVALFAFAVVVAAALAPTAASYVLLHGHNLVPFVLLLFYRDARRGALVTFLAGALGLALIFSGIFDDTIVRGSALPRSLPLDAVLATLAPPSFAPALALRVAASFLFLQSVHYAIWLRLLPDAARERPGLRGFQSSARALAASLGTPLLALAAFAWCALFGIALFGNAKQWARTASSK